MANRLHLACIRLHSTEADCSPLLARSFAVWHRIPQNTNQVEKILVSSAKANFSACLEGFKAVTAEKKKQVQELLENEVLSGR